MKDLFWKLLNRANPSGYYIFLGGGGDISGLCRHVVDAVPPMDLVPRWTVLHCTPVHEQLPRESVTHDVGGKGGVLSCRDVPQ